MRPLTVSAPGKLILMGEHAVVYGQPALVTAVDRRLRARFSPESEHTVLELAALDHRERVTWVGLLEYASTARRRWRQYAAKPSAEAFARMRGGDPAHVVKVALGETQERLAVEPAPVRVRIESSLPIGSGFGSSAAVAVAVVTGYLLWRDEPAGIERVERLALEVERRQHGFPSGVDAATVLRGGLVWAERPEADERLVLKADEGRPEHLDRFRVFDTGGPAHSTGAVVAAVRERVESDLDRFDPVLARMGRTTRAFREALTGADAPAATVMELIRTYEADLETLGVVPRGLAARIRELERAGGAAKISGAGALEPEPGMPDAAGTLLVYHPEPARLDALECLAGLERYDIRLGAEGVRREHDA